MVEVVSAALAEVSKQVHSEEPFYSSKNEKLQKRGKTQWKLSNPKICLM